MDEQELLREMESQNKWWVGQSIKLDERLIERPLLERILGEIAKKGVTGLIGLRRVGKTTILRQVIHSLLESGVKPKNIFFISFDGFKKEERTLKQAIGIYFRDVLETTPDSLGETVYMFFDEVQKIKEWGEEIKSFYDKGYKIKFFVSGSSSMNILRGSGESLVGRINIHTVYPFSFREFLGYFGVEAQKTDIFKIKAPIGSEKCIALFNKYLKVGGFPELYDIPADEVKAKLKTYIDLTFYRDIVNLFEVKRPDVLEGLFYSLLKESGNIANYSNLAASLQTKFETLKTYIEYLNYSFLISKSLFFSKSRKSVEKNPKVYVSDVSFSNLSEIEEGLKIETVVYNHCRLLADSGDFDFISYWCDKMDEVDVVLQRGNEIIPIEVKYREDPKRLGGLLKFMERFSVKKGFVVTKDLLEEKKLGDKTISFIPAWLFLLSV